MGMLCKRDANLVPIKEILQIGTTPEETFLDLDALERVRTERKKRLAEAQKPRTREEIEEDAKDYRK